MPKKEKPWLDKNNLLKDGEACLDGKKHNLKMVFHARHETLPEKGYKDFVKSLPDGHVLSEIVYRCSNCKKYKRERFVYPKKND